MINKFLYAYKKAKRDNPLVICFYRVGDNYEAYYDDAERINIALDTGTIQRQLSPDVIVATSVTPVDQIDHLVTRLHQLGIGTRLSEQRVANGTHDIACDDYYYEFPFD